MKKIVWTLLGISMAVNLWLFFRLQPLGATVVVVGRSGASVSNDPAGKSVAVTAGAKSADGKTAAVDPARLAAVLKALVELDENDLPGARDRLRALGADERTVFAAVDGVIVLDYYRLQRTTEIENIRSGWWRGDPASVNRPAWGKLAESKLFAVMGYDPNDIMDFSSRFEFLPQEKAGTLAKIAMDYRSLYLRAAEDPTMLAGATNLAATERRADVVKLLTPEELAEYDLRFSDFASQNAKRFAKMQATEEEFRRLSPLLEQAQQEVAAVTRDPNLPAAQRMAAQRAVEQRALDQLVANVGYDRAVDYIWSGLSAVVVDRSTSTAADMAATPKSGPLMQLASEAGAQAAAIHADSGLSIEAKRAALLALQQAVQPKLDQLLSPEDRATLNPAALAWFNGLAKGEYVSITPQVTGNLSMILSPVSVAAPPRTEPQPRIQLRRPN